MPRKRTILDSINCPRCNATAQLRAEDRTSNIFTIRIVCPKCKYEKGMGISTWNGYHYDQLIKRLKEWLDRTHDEALKTVIRGKIQAAEKKNPLKELGL